MTRLEQLQEIFSGIDDDKKRVIEPLISDVVFTTGTEKIKSRSEISFSGRGFFDPFVKGKDLLALGALDQNLIAPAKRGPGSCMAALDAGNRSIHCRFHSRISFGSFFAASGTSQYQQKK